MLYRGTFFIDGSGTVIIQFFSIDNAGNEETPKQVEIKIDRTPPITYIYLDPPVPDGLHDWYVSDVLVTLNATDNESGVSKIRVPSLPGGVYTEPFLVTEDCYNNIRISAVDNVGNIEAVKVLAIKIDMTKPVLSMVYNWTGSPLHGYEMIYTVTANDALSGMDRVEFYKNDELQETITSPGPDYEWLDHNISSFHKLHVRGFICSLNITDDLVTFYAILTLNLGFDQIFPHIRAYAYDRAGNQAYDEIEQPSLFEPIPPGTYVYLSLLKKVTLPNDYEGYIGRFFINATFYNRD